MLVIGVIDLGATEQVGGPGQLVLETQVAKPAGEGQRLTPVWHRCQFVPHHGFCSEAITPKCRMELHPQTGCSGSIKLLPAALFLGEQTCFSASFHGRRPMPGSGCPLLPTDLTTSQTGACSCPMHHPECGPVPRAASSSSSLPSRVLSTSPGTSRAAARCANTLANSTTCRAASPWAPSRRRRCLSHGEWGVCVVIKPKLPGARCPTAAGTSI